MHKIKQLQKGKEVHAEPAVRWWADKRNSWKYIPVVLKLYRNKFSTAIGEAIFITRAQPSLNMPLIVRKLQDLNQTRKRKGGTHICAKYERPHTGFKLYRKLKGVERKRGSTAYLFGKTNTWQRSEAWCYRGSITLAKLASRS